MSASGGTTRAPLGRERHTRLPAALKERQVALPVVSTVALPAFIDPEHLISAFGLVGLLVIIFAECGLLIGFFLPGDTLLFSAGLLVATDIFHISIWLLVVLVSVAAIVGNLVGYWIGRTAGPAVFNRPNSRLFRQEYVERSHAFFEKYGAQTIVLARFVPIVRTFATVMAGASRMRFATYVVYSVVGGVVWAVGVTLLGYYLGHIPFVQQTIRPLIEPVLVGIIVLSLVPAAVEMLRSRRRSRPSAESPDSARLDARASADGGAAD
jgi:membrane-associated protein